MSKTTKIALILCLLLPIILVIMVVTSEKSNATEKENCRYTGYVNLYLPAHQEVELPAEAFEMKYHDYRCNVRGMRLEGTRFNTETEYLWLKKYVVGLNDRVRQPILFCHNGNNVGRMVTLKSVWTGIKINRAEEKNFARWVENRSKAAGCTRYS